MATTGKKAVVATPDPASTPSIQDISDAYLYLLGRLLVLRQEHLDFRKDGAVWNRVVHHEAGDVAFGPPDPDMGYSEAWIAVDDHTCTLIEIPTMVGRYYTIQILNPWGETIANINERTNPNHPSGAFLVCSKDARVTLPTGSATQRVDIPGRKARLLIGVQHGADPGEAWELRQRIRVRPTGTTTIPRPVEIPLFTKELLPGVEVFDTALAVINSEPDVNPGADIIQQKVHDVAGVTASSMTARRRVEGIIRQYAIPALKKQISAMSITGNGWSRFKTAGSYADNFVMRTAVNLTRMWANTHDEIVQFENGQVHPLNGRYIYSMTFPKDDLPFTHVKYLWSLTCVDAMNLQVMPNPQDRFLLDSQSPLEISSDGSMTLYFAPQKPVDAPDANWLPTPAGQPYVLMWRSYGPDQMTVAGTWFPPPLKRGFHHRSRRRDIDEPDAE
ncbi:MAG TPA: DUF1214 domain-containing protein [Vicinamibacterales bacterium]|jgi:hypothetical protein